MNLRPARRDLAVAVVLAVAVGVVEVALRPYLTRPFWYDEIWRAHYVSEPAGRFWPELARANTPSAAGWVGATRLAGMVLGWHAWVLRLPETVALPLLAAGMYLLTRRFAGAVAGAVAGAAVGLNGTVLDLGTQLKPYTLEAVVTVAVVALWISGPPDRPGRAATIRLAGRRTGAGLLALFSVPGLFVVGPLAVADAATSPRGQRRRALLTGLPGVALAAVHTVVFVGHQSGQRHARYWDRQFLAGRGVFGGATFVWRQLVATAGGAPPGIDRYDPNLVHAATDRLWVSPWVLAPAIAVCWVAGARVLWRRRDGRVVLAALLGAEAMALAASAMRYWPFGPVRVNLFLVPLIVLVTAVGGQAVAGSAVGFGRRLAGADETAGRFKPGAAALPVVALAGVVLVASMSGGGRLWDRRHRLRGVDLMVDAADATRRLAGPNDVVVVAGRLARPGWIYAMETSDDGAAPHWEYAGWPGPAGRPPLGAARRVPLDRVLFVSRLGDGETAVALRSRRSRPARLVLFVFDLDRGRTAAEFAELRVARWCPTGAPWTFPRTGQLSVLAPCRPAGGDLGRSPRPPARRTV